MAGNNGQKNDAAKTQEYQELLRKVAERVWELWREDMRRGQERRGQIRRS
jgi:hypothetical protein